MKKKKTREEESAAAEVALLPVHGEEPERLQTDAPLLHLPCCLFFFSFAAHRISCESALDSSSDKQDVVSENLRSNLRLQVRFLPETTG